MAAPALARFDNAGLRAMCRVPLGRAGCGRCQDVGRDRDRTSCPAGRVCSARSLRPIPERRILVNEYVPVVAALTGTIIGAAAGYAGQWAQAKRADEKQLLDLRRALYVDLLGSSHDLFEATRQCYREHPISDGGSRVELKRSLSLLSTSACRRSMDEIRIVCESKNVALAELLTHHLRHSGVVGGSIPPPALREWIAGYWDRRHDFIQGVRTELGIATSEYVMTSVDKVTEADQSLTHEPRLLPEEH